MRGWVTILFLILGAARGANAQGDHVVVRPKELSSVLVNPGMGITTFQRFNQQALNPGLTWSEEGPTKPLPRVESIFPESTVSYCRWFWGTLEPVSGQIRWEILDSALNEARLHRQTLAIRLMPYDEEHPLPEWYRNSGAHRANLPEDKDGKIWQPDFSDPLYLKCWGRLVSAVGARYDGHPFLDSVDISTIGYWGEGWSPYMPGFTQQKALIDVYLEAFPRTPLLMNFDEEHALAYAVKKGTGWRLDCWGDMRKTSDDPFFPPEMLDIYPQQIVRAGIEEAWQQAPVSLEACWVPGHWKQRGWDLDYILDQALRWHASTVNIKSCAIPEEWRGKFDAFQKRLGYRFILRRLEYPRSIGAGSMMPISSWWFNGGVAPVYRPYCLAIQLSGPGQSAIIRTSARVQQWLPGDAVFDSALYVPESLFPGNYHFRVALLDPNTGKPAIRLAIEGQEPDGWTDLGEIEILKPR
jgi:hypothetical protein